MELALGQKSLQTATTAVASNTLPTGASDGVDVSTWKQAGYQYTRLLVYIEGDGTARTLDKPTGGAGGAELWTYRVDQAGSAKWWLIAYLNGGVVVPVPAAGGKVEGVSNLAVGDRLLVVGTVSAGVVSYSFEPVEFIAQLVM